MNNHFIKRFALLTVLTLLTAVLLAACTTESPVPEDDGTTDEGGTSDGELIIGLSISTLNNPFFVTLKEGAEQAAEELGVRLIVVDAQDDPAKQVADVEDLVQQQVDAILVNPTDGAAIVTAIETANQASIPVITVDRGAEGGEVLAHVASDNVEGGKMAGEFIIELLGGSGKVVELEGIPGTSAARDRGQGFNEAVGDAEGIEIVASQPADFDRSKGLTVMENILQSHAEIDAVFAHNDEMALGALQAIEAAGRDIIVVGFDATDDAVQAVQEGRLAATVAQQPSLIGQLAVETAVKALNGESVDEMIPVELELVTE
ncbi:ribose transport system substrate-binding protein [Caldalkalibacillus uzonensis]|uniref:Ribose transport system substrate-binding protein n=1 Tax=Caldalkalibacillus uzonensis TaxID=353224 RepID=A0ABU0CS65_9BACI|nr:ribose ABC transporter substrate-binding protein RbsB [Caldalkalibacillus uzonensis]MDQ0338716.1 ribose transport system substrate-binding protein [Caldalkalibacillus uzonensis]